MAFTFGFNGTFASGSGADTFVNNSPFAFTEAGVTFTMSGTGTSAGYDYWIYDPDLPNNDGQFEILQSLGSATFEMTFTDGLGNANLTGNVVLDVFGAGAFSWLTTNGVTAGTVAGVDNAAFAATGGTEITGIRFTLSPGQKIEIDSLTSADGNVVCFLEGTRIATPDGARAVEDLKAGDRILTSTGGETTVRWLGEMPINPRLEHPAKVNPICISAGSLADNVPARDLHVSADHAIAIDGLLINAGALVNGRSIYQVRKMPLDGFTYYHVETDAHELLLAEGVAAESFIDYAGRDAFANADEAEDVVIPEMDLPRISAARLLPERLRAFLAERAEALGRRRAA